MQRAMRSSFSSDALPDLVGSAARMPRGASTASLGSLTGDAGIWNTSSQEIELLSHRRADEAGALSTSAAELVSGGMSSQQAAALAAFRGVPNQPGNSAGKEIAAIMQLQPAVDPTLGATEAPLQQHPAQHQQPLHGSMFGQQPSGLTQSASHNSLLGLQQSGSHSSLLALQNSGLLGAQSQELHASNLRVNSQELHGSSLLAAQSQDQNGNGLLGMPSQELLASQGFAGSAVSRPHSSQQQQHQQQGGFGFRDGPHGGSASTASGGGPPSGSQSSGGHSSGGSAFGGGGHAAHHAQHSQHMSPLGRPPSWDHHEVDDAVPWSRLDRKLVHVWIHEGRCLPPEEVSSSAAPDAIYAELDEAEQVSRHLWIGNLAPSMERSTLLNVAQGFGPLEDLTTFELGAHAFISFQSVQHACRAFELLDNQQVPVLSGQRPLVVKFRPAARNPRLLRPTSGGGARNEGDAANGPSARLWLGNISNQATAGSVRAAFESFGPVVDAAAFPARVGPLGYAIVVFERVEDAVRAVAAKSNRPDPLLTGSRPLKMRYKQSDKDHQGSRRSSPSHPASHGGGALSGAPLPQYMPNRLDSASPPNGIRRLALDHLSPNVDASSIQLAFGQFGPLEKICSVPPSQEVHIVFRDPSHAAAAQKSLNGAFIPSLTGSKPLAVRFVPKDGVPSPQSGLARPPSSAAAGAGNWHGGIPRPELSASDSSEEDQAMPAVNLSNRLNPNNIHFDRVLAAQYKRMSKPEKEALWAQDRLMQQRAQQGDATGPLRSSLARMRLGGTRGDAFGMNNRPFSHADLHSLSSAYSDLNPYASHPDLASLAAQAGLVNPLAAASLAASQAGGMGRPFPQYASHPALSNAVFTERQHHQQQQLAAQHQQQQQHMSLQQAQLQHLAALQRKQQQPQQGQLPAHAFDPSRQGMMNALQGSMQNLGSGPNLAALQGSMQDLQNLAGSAHNLQALQGSSQSLQALQGSMQNLQGLQGSMQNLQSLQSQMQSAGHGVNSADMQLGVHGRGSPSQQQQQQQQHALGSSLMGRSASSPHINHLNMQPPIGSRLATAGSSQPGGLAGYAAPSNSTGGGGVGQPARPAGLYGVQSEQNLASMDGGGGQSSLQQRQQQQLSDLFSASQAQFGSGGVSLPQGLPQNLAMGQPGLSAAQLGGNDLDATVAAAVANAFQDLARQQQQQQQQQQQHGRL